MPDRSELFDKFGKNKSCFHQWCRDCDLCVGLCLGLGTRTSWCKCTWVPSVRPFMRGRELSGTRPFRSITWYRGWANEDVVRICGWSPHGFSPALLPTPRLAQEVQRSHPLWGWVLGQPSLRRRWAKRPSATASHQGHTLGCSHRQSDWSLRSCTCRSSEKQAGQGGFCLMVRPSTRLTTSCWQSYWAIVEVTEMVRF